MKSLTLNIAIVLFTFVAFTAKAQNNHKINIGITEFSSVEIVGDDVISFDMVAPANPGEAITFKDREGSNNAYWLNYSSITGSDNANTITATLDTEIEGVIIKANVGINATSTGKKGKTGTGLQLQTLKAGTGTVVVNNIKSCYTGSGVGNGHSNVYSLEPSANDVAYGNIVASSPQVTVTYTITGN